MTTTTTAIPLSSQALNFESIYVDAQGERDRIPWEDGLAHSALINWLNVVAPSIVRCGARVAVVGCGLGEDARVISRRGYDVTAFDCSPTAIEWAQRLDPTQNVTYQVADLFDIPGRWRHRFDLVVENYTLQALPIEQRHDAMRSIGEMMSPHGHMLVICRGRVEGESLGDGPPWPFTEQELIESASQAGLRLDGEMANFMDESADPSRRRLRGVFRRA